MLQSVPNASLIKLIHDRLEKNANNALRDQGLTMMQVSVLITLHDAQRQQLSMKELEQRFGVAQSTVAGIVSRLEQKGLVEALHDAEDRRVKLVHLTREGECCYANAAFQMDEAERSLLRGLSNDEQAALNRFLTILAENAK